MEENLPKIEGISPSMLWNFMVVLVGLAALLVLAYKVIEIVRKEIERKEKRRQLNGQDITDQIANKVMERLQPELDKKFDEIDKKLASDKETLISHTHQLNAFENRVSKLENGNKALCHGILALLERDSTLVNAQNAMKSYLIDGKYNENDWK